MLPAEAQTTSVTPDDRLGEVLDPKGTYLYQRGYRSSGARLKSLR